MRRSWGRFAVIAIAVAGTSVAVTLPAGAHEISAADISCTSVSATVTTDNLSLGPFTWSVKVGDGAFQQVTTTETSLPAPEGQAITLVTGDITSLTSGLQGQPASVQAFISWPGLPEGDQTFEATVTCGTVPPTDPPAVVPPPQVAGEVVATPVVAAARFTG